MANKRSRARQYALQALYQWQVSGQDVAEIEQQFLDVACRKLYGSPFVIATIDTLVIAQRLLTLRNHSIQTGDLRLFNLRPRYNLPQYKAHNALSDAVATAELFLAMAAEINPNPKHCRLEQFLTD